MEQGKALCLSGFEAIKAAMDQDERSAAETARKIGARHDAGLLTVRQTRAAVLAMRRKVRCRTMLLGVYATLVLYYRDIIDELLTEWPVAPTDFVWLRNVR